jgi:spore germination protein YaaH
MKRTRVRRRRLGGTLTAGLIAGLCAGPLGHAVASDGGQPVPVASYIYVVRFGDTLWSIARGISPSADPRPIVDAIARSNAVAAGSLVPGQTIVIPLSG